MATIPTATQVMSGMLVEVAGAVEFCVMVSEAVFEAAVAVAGWRFIRLYQFKMPWNVSSEITGVTQPWNLSVL